MKRFKGLIITLAVIAFLGLWVGGTYNSLVSYNEKVNNSYAQIQNNLQRRADLIPNLVETVKGYAKHEKEVLNNIADARAKLAGAKSIPEQAAANEQLNGALSRLLVVVENYPNLKADANFRQLMDELAGTENRIAVARKDYNDTVRAYNVKIKKFPTVIFANMFGFEEKPYFEASQDAQKTPKVNF
ncbi:LemA family protein [Fervidicella metallireducens AeB]|uniref:LemA family protein n=1 Tax=Fervidicella metallireducens AeB TaxID=1403537 RepID=A0A017RTE0_9CLOT|nr:LemA family protein [Fervidicella metallireducens]EYE87876.1 LemA family protein [Fervidicella metallireducens AeB]